MTEPFDEMVDAIAQRAESVTLEGLRGPLGGWDGTAWTWRWMNSPEGRERIEVRLMLQPQPYDHSGILRWLYSCWLAAEPKAVSGAEMGSVRVPEGGQYPLPEWLQKVATEALRAAQECATTLPAVGDHRRGLRADLDAEERKLLRRTSARP